MTDRLSQLLHDEAADLDVPAPDPGTALARGRRMRRRRSATVAGTAAAVLLVVGAGAIVVTGAGGDDSAVDPAAAMAAYQTEGAFAVGRDLYIGDTHVRWKDSIKAIYYSSAGVMIRSGESSDTNEGDSVYTLVTPTGDTRQIDVSMGDRIPGFEPDSPHFAYAAARDDGDVDVVVHDLETNEELARVTVDGSAGFGWEAPPASIDGDVVWVRFDDGVTEVNWRTSEVRHVPETDAVHEIANGRYVDWRQQRWVVRTMADGSVVREMDLAPGWYGFFSPDGRYLRAFENMGDDPVEPFYYEIFDVATGASRKLSEDQSGEDMGWTPDGKLLSVDGDTVSVCEPLADECTTERFDRGEGALKIGGEPYES